MTSSFDVVVVGLGHAGAEAALAAARLGCRTASITQSLARACLMSCNPAIGGPGKSQLVHELDALGGAMPQATDASALQLRILNRSKGPAIWATRAQVDRAAYALAMQRRLVAAAERLELIEDEVAMLLVEGDGIRGLRLASGREIRSRAVVLTTGTFLSAVMHVGDEAREGGRHGDQASTGLSQSLRALGLRTGRFRTGTPPRLLGSSIDFSACVEQPSEPDALPFSRETDRRAFPLLRQRSCFATRTREETHAVVRENLLKSSLFKGTLGGRGPRYCPALELKVSGHPERQGHPVYLEPEGGVETRDEVFYPAGLSTSLPAEVQLAMLRTIPGLERVEMTRAGYAVEYDYLAGGQLQSSLETRQLSGLFCAGQINGSSGYEEAAGQGLVAGVNAARVVRGQSAWIPDPSRSYLGVLCEDLTQKGFEEPYRLLPARAEARLSLREGNAALRLGAAAAELGLVEPSRTARVVAMREEIERALRALSAVQLRRLRHPDLTFEQAREEIPVIASASLDAAREVYLDTRYAPYEAQRLIAEGRLAEVQGLVIPPGLRYSTVIGLSGEAVDVLGQRRPTTLAEARKLPGINGSAIALLAAHLRRRERTKAS